MQRWPGPELASWLQRGWRMELSFSQVRQSDTFLLLVPQFLRCLFRLGGRGPRCDQDIGARIAVDLLCCRLGTWACLSHLPSLLELSEEARLRLES